MGFGWARPSTIRKPARAETMRKRAAAPCPMDPSVVFTGPGAPFLRDRAVGIHVWQWPTSKGRHAGSLLRRSPVSGSSRRRRRNGHGAVHPRRRCPARGNEELHGGARERREDGEEKSKPIRAIHLPRSQRNQKGAHEAHA